MSTKKKLFLSAAGAAGGASLDVDDVFSTYLYEGQSAFSVVNGIDMAANGGLVWIKNRDYTKSHRLFSTGLTNLGHHLEANSTNGEADLSTQGITSFNSNGWSVGTGNSETNASGWGNYVSWTFRKAPKFFDIVTYTGNGTAGRTVAHNLESVPGMIIVKCTSHGSTLWAVYHRGMDPSAPEDYFLRLNDNGSRGDYTYWNDTAPTSTEFTLNGHDDVNQSSRTYVAYLFAHNNSDGEFGPSGDQDIIKCGTYATNSSAKASINLGFEPQWIIFRPYDDTADFKIIDNMRGFMGGQPASGFYNKALSSNGNYAEYDEDGIHITPTGFEHVSGFASKNFVYTAIRRGPLATPTSATDVFAMDDRSGGPPNAVSGFPVDMGLHTNLTSNDNRYINARLIQGKRLFANLTSVEGSSSEAAFDYMTGFIDRSDTSTDNIHYMWKRAPSFFDVVTYTGDGTASRQITHNLGATPQWVMVKPRSLVGNWINWFAPFGDDHYFTLTQYGRTDTAVFFNTADSTSFTLGTGGSMNNSGENYIVFLFGSLSGISKVGTYTGNGTNQNIDCGFSSGARFVLIRQDIDSVSTSDWFIYDTFRGLVAGNDKRLELNTTDLQDTDTDSIDPYSAGFNVVQESEANLNVSGQTYVFYAIA